MNNEDELTTNNEIPKKNFFANKYIFLVLIILSLTCTFAFGAEGEDQGWWAEMLWGTESNPGVLRSVFVWFNDMAFFVFESLLSQTLALIPSADFNASDVTLLVGYFNIANCWIPLQETFTMLFAYWVFVASFSGLKLILKLIPAIG